MEIRMVDMHPITMLFTTIALSVLLLGLACHEPDVPDELVWKTKNEKVCFNSLVEQFKQNIPYIDMNDENLIEEVRKHEILYNLEELVWKGMLEDTLKDYELKMINNEDLPESHYEMINIVRGHLRKVNRRLGIKEMKPLYKNADGLNLNNYPRELLLPGPILVLHRIIFFYHYRIVA